MSILTAFLLGLLVGLLLGAAFAYWGAIENIKDGSLYYKSRSGRWYPRDPRR